MESTTSHELQVVRSGDDETSGSVPIDALPPTDRGRGAYVALACCTIAQAPIWGMPDCQGITVQADTRS